MLDLEATKLLPPNATPVEIDIISVVVNRINRVYIDIRSLIESKLSKSNSSLIPYVIEEFGFGAVSKYIPDNDQFMAEGIRWKKDRGTPASAIRALNWIFREDDLLENTKAWHWTVVEIRLTKDIPSLAAIKDIVYLVRQSLPARSQLLRVWSGTDFPMMILNETYLNESRLNVPGGEWDENLKLWLFINNKDDVILPNTNDTFQAFSAVLNNVILKQTLDLNEDGLLNSNPGVLYTLTVPAFVDNHVTFGPYPISLASLISLGDDTDLADIVEHLGCY